MSLAELYPEIDLTHCVRIDGLYGDNLQDLSPWGSKQEISLEPGMAEFEEILSLFQEWKFRRSLQTLLPSQWDRRQHQAEEWRFQMDPLLHF